ncbi:MAG TPA: Kdo hydroxylase family protein [Candidatus Angelobacter sp.]
MESDNLASQTIEVTGYAPEQARWYCDQLERGQVLVFREVPFDFPGDDRKFLLARSAAESRFHKNISYRPASGNLRGSAGRSDHERLQRVMRNFSQQAAQFVSRFLAPYAGQLKLDFASFRPLAEEGRELPLHKRNDLLHVDAFPTRPTRGGRILRAFININPSAGRVWRVGAPFHAFVPGFVRAQQLDPPYRGATARVLARAGAKLGLPVRDRSRYDEFMLYLHDWLKENADFQKNSPKREVVFPPGCFWMVYTDGVPHAVMSGQFALEQTFIIPPQALVSPEAAPVRVLESATGTRMVN